jgi:hypothetical protein
VQRNGYNLLELAIATAVLGLFIGAVLTAISMVSSANIRNLTNQISSIHNGAYNFRLKYAALPGDISANGARDNNLTLRSGSPGRGDGNDKIEGCATHSPDLGCESILFWRDLKLSDMAGVAFQRAEDTLVDGTTASFTIHDYLPGVAVVRDTSLHMFPNASDGWSNSIYIAKFTTVSKLGVLTPAPSFSAIKAAEIDQKIDDASPLEGKLRAMRDLSTLASAPAADAEGGCITQSKQGLVYDTDGANGSSATCQLALRASF